MAEDIEKEVTALQQEFEWLLREEVHNVLKELHAILSEACKRFPVHLDPGNDNLVRPEKFILTSPNGAQQVKCVITLLADNICEADLTLKLNKQQPAPFYSKIYPDIPWRVQQIQDAGNHLLQAMAQVDSYDQEFQFTTAQQVLHILDNIIECLNRSRAALALPRKKTLEELVKNVAMKAFKPTLPNDTVVSFYIQAQKLVLAVYSLCVNQSQKIDISARYQVECSVPWLNDTLVLFTLALQQCQHLRDKVSVFIQYEEETKFLVQGKLNTNTGCSQSPQTGLLVDFEEQSRPPATNVEQAFKGNPLKTALPQQDNPESLITTF